MKAVRIFQTGDPKVLKYEDNVPLPSVEKNTVRIKNHACGVNYIDTYHRSGLYKVNFPFIPGTDGAGVIESIGEGSEGFKIGDRVAYCIGGTGSYAEYTTMPSLHVYKLPDKISFDEGCTAMVQGLTAHYLLRSSYEVKKGDTIFVHAAAGGLGSLLCQIGKHLGAKVIGTVSTEEKAKLAKESGCDEVILYTQKDFEEETKKITSGKGVNVVYDSIGKDTFQKSLNILAPRGFLVLCGNASGAPPPIDPLGHLSKGSYTVTRPSLGHFIPTKEEFLSRCNELFKWVEDGHVKFTVGLKLPLSESAQAHTLLEGRKTTGKIILTI